MLWGNNDEALIRRGVNEAVVPFYQRWQELLNKKTLDIYQYKVMTSLSAMKEMVRVIKKTQDGLFTTNANVETCRQELLFILGRDKIMEKYYGAILNQLRNALRNCSKKDVSQYRSRILYRLNYVIHQIEPHYLKYGLKELKLAITDKRMEDIESYINIVVSQSIYNGWSAEGLMELLRFFYNE